MEKDLNYPHSFRFQSFSRNTPLSKNFHGNQVNYQFLVCYFMSLFLALECDPFTWCCIYLILSKTHIILNLVICPKTRLSMSSVSTVSCRIWNTVPRSDNLFNSSLRTQSSTGEVHSCLAQFPENMKTLEIVRVENSVADMGTLCASLS